MMKRASLTVFLVGIFTLGAFCGAEGDIIEWKEMAMEVSQKVGILESMGDLKKVFISPLVCSGCHARHHEEWDNSYHAKSVRNAGFQALYLKYLDDLKKEEIKQALGREAGPKELRQCLFCHAPMVQFASDKLVQQISDAIAGGKWDEIQEVQVSCVVCHAITPEMKWTGVFGLTGTMYGPIEDPAPSAVSGHQSKFSPLHKESKFCGLCHSKGTFNVYCSLVYEQSKSVKENVKECQDCHMEAEGKRAVAVGGKERSAHSHFFPGGRHKEMWAKALDLSLEVEKTSGELRVQVTMKNKIPHNIPDG